MNAILVVSTTGLGDSLWGTPALRALKKSFPEVHIDLLINPRWKSLFDGNPYIRRVIDYHPQWYRQLWLACTLLPDSYDHNLIFHANKDYRRMPAWTRSANTLAHQSFSWLPAESIIPVQRPIHGIQRRLRLIEAVGAKTDGSQMDIFLTEGEQQEVTVFLKKIGFSGNPFIYVNVGASLPHKRWPADRFIELSKNILKQTTFNIILGGGPEDEALIASIRAHLDPARSYPSCHRSIRENCALIRQARLLITTDTGPLHIGLALNTPLSALFGPTLSEESGPFQASDHLCKIIQAHEDHDSLKKDVVENCFNSITVSEVWNKTREALGL